MAHFRNKNPLSAANCDSGKVFGDLLINYGKKLQSDSMVVSNCLQTIGEFHNFLEDTKLRLVPFSLSSESFVVFTNIIISQPCCWRAFASL